MEKLVALLELAELLGDTNKALADYFFVSSMVGANTSFTRALFSKTYGNFCHHEGASAVRANQACLRHWGAKTIFTGLSFALCNVLLNVETIEIRAKQAQLRAL